MFIYQPNVYLVPAMYAGLSVCSSREMSKIGPDLKSSNSNKIFTDT